MKYTIKQLIERLDIEIENVCCDSARVDWQTLKSAVLAQQTNNNRSHAICPFYGKGSCERKLAEVADSARQYSKKVRANSRRVR